MSDSLCVYCTSKSCVCEWETKRKTRKEKDKTAWISAWWIPPSFLPSSKLSIPPGHNLSVLWTSSYQACPIQHAQPLFPALKVSLVNHFFKYASLSSQQSGLKAISMSATDALLSEPCMQALQLCLQTHTSREKNKVRSTVYFANSYSETL